MGSRQIQFFGLIGTSVLILFVVIFLGNDIYKVYQHYLYDFSVPGLEDDQIVMESHAVKDLQNMLNGQSSEMLASSALREEDPKAKQTIVEEKRTDPLSASDQTLLATSDTEAVSEPVDVEEKQPVVSAPEKMTRELRHMLATADFFHPDFRLTAENREVLDLAVEKLRKLSYPYTLQVEGHSEAGVARYISSETAAKVAAYLKEKLPGVTIKSVGYGNSYPVSDLLEDPQNRRIEIIVRRSEG